MNDNLRITADSGFMFRIAVIREGDRYGLDNRLYHNRPDPLIEVYDVSPDLLATFGPGGQFVSRYYASTIARSLGNGIALDGRVARWSVDGAAWAPVVAIARRISPKWTMAR